MSRKDTPQRPKPVEVVDPVIEEMNEEEIIDVDETPTEAQSADMSPLASSLGKLVPLLLDIS